MTPPNDRNRVQTGIGTYQALAVETAIYPDQRNNVLYPLLGLVDEVGELVDKYYQGCLSDNNGCGLDSATENLLLAVVNVAKVAGAFKKAIRDSHYVIGGDVFYRTKELLQQCAWAVDNARASFNGSGHIVVTTHQPSHTTFASMVGELGDVLWYWSQAGYEMRVDSGVVALKNLDKLADRKARGVLRGSGDDR